MCENCKSHSTHEPHISQISSAYMWCDYNLAGRALLYRTCSNNKQSLFDRTVRTCVALQYVVPGMMLTVQCI